MAHIVTDACVRCKYTDCVAVCPVECFYETESMLVIHPDECIDCGACIPECPVEAIYIEDEIPEEFDAYIELNRRVSLKLEADGAEPICNPNDDPHPEHEKYKEVVGKFALI